MVVDRNGHTAATGDVYLVAGTLRRIEGSTDLLLVLGSAGGLAIRVKPGDVCLVDDALAGGGGGGAPTTADYLVKTANAGLSAERVVTDDVTIVWDWSAPGVAKAVRAALTGDVTVAAGSNTSAIAAGAVTLSHMAALPATTLIGRYTPSSGTPQSITIGTGLSLASGVLSATSASPPTGTGFRHMTGGAEDAAAKLVADADCTTDSITVGKMHATATDRLFGRSTAGAGPGEELPCTAFGRSLVGDANAAAGRATLGLTSAAMAPDGLSTGDLLAWSGAWTIVNEPAADDRVLVSVAGDVPKWIQLTTSQIDPGAAILLTQLQSIATARFIGRTTAGTGALEALTSAQLTAALDAFTSLLKGLVPASGGGTTNFLRADGTWAAPPGGGGGGFTTTLVEKDVGSSPAMGGTFDITGLSGLTTGKTVLVVEDSSTDLSNGETPDRLECDQVHATGHVQSSTTIRVYWHSATPVAGLRKFAYSVAA